MKLKARNPNSPEVRQEVLEFFRDMTSEERSAFMNYRTPGVEETDMTGMFGLYEKDAKKPAKEGVATSL